MSNKAPSLNIVKTKNKISVYLCIFTEQTYAYIH